MPSPKSNDMRRYLIYIIMAVTAALMMCGCAADFDAGIGDAGSNPDPSRPTVPIKRRPIVPSTKLPRPRLIAKVAWKGDNTLAVTLTESVPSAEVVVRDVLSGTEYGYLFEGAGIYVVVPDNSVEVEVRIGGEYYVYTVGEKNEDD